MPESKVLSLHGLMDGIRAEARLLRQPSSPHSGVIQNTAGSRMGFSHPHPVNPALPRYKKPAPLGMAAGQRGV